ncbi:hypothetical protein LWC08_01680 [Desulfobaculum bizertense]|uniref:hypothetical protein n=1 Tax=Desulfobaculum bizertense TaxID=376490 RepID=UPI001F3DED0A|nr:hypothetical protein [Desulfobaculum bizertense]UIJ38299.1 hypothetical protein LWC08_01680 [Desulfobaculum bizertense]
MFNLKPPFRMMIANSFRDEQPRNAQSLLDELRDEYGSERQFTKSHVENHLMSLKAVGILRDFDAEITESGQLVPRYVITPYGKGKIQESC